MIEYSKTKQDLIDKTNAAISELIYSKSDLQKAYNYYHGKRDAEQYRYLEENFGIGNPTAVEFVPLIRKHIDALVGEFLGTPIIPKVSCKDYDTISKITREKELLINTQVSTFLRKRLQNKIMAFIQTGQEASLQDPDIEQSLQTLMDDIGRSFTSSFETAAQNVLEYIMQSRQTDIYTKLKQLFLDLLITGYAFYKVRKSSSGNNIYIEVLNPLNVFIDRNPESPYVKDSYRVVVRHWYTQTQILNKYSKYLNKEEIANIKEHWKSTYSEGRFYIRNIENRGVPNWGIDGTNAVAGYPDETTNSRNYQFIPVYEVEWIETDPKGIMHRQSVVRIGEEIYITLDEDEDVIRSKDNPDQCGLSVNGVYFLNRSSKPFSLMITCMSLQDKYDLLMYYRDTLIANSGTTGDWVDLSLLPTALGVSLPERLQKFIAYKKTGIAPIDTSQEGRLAGGQASPNTIFSGYDDTIKAQAVQAIQLAIEDVERTASSITGVFRERLNGIEQRDAVSNIKQGVNNSFIISKQYFQQMDLIVNEMLVDCLNIAKKVYKNGLTGTLILGDKQQKIFTALSEHFTFTDYDIHITTTTDTLKDLETLKQTIPQLVSSQLVGPDMLLETITTKNLPDLKYKFKIALKKQEEKNNIIQQLQQQLDQAQQQLQQTQKQAQQLQQQLQQFDQQKMQIEQQRLKMENEIAWFNARTEREFKEATAEQDKRRTDIELMQLHDGNPYNDEVKNI